MFNLVKIVAENDLKDDTFVDNEDLNKEDEELSDEDWYKLYDLLNLNLFYYHYPNRII